MRRRSFDDHDGRMFGPGEERFWGTRRGAEGDEEDHQNGKKTFVVPEHEPDHVEVVA